MRTLTLAVVAAALLIVPVGANAQQDATSDLWVPSRKRQGPDFGTQKTPEQLRAEQRAYEAALRKIPVPGQKYDPWNTVRTGDKPGK